MVEIMIVVAIIGVLATIATPTAIRARENSQAVRVTNDLRVFHNAFEIHAIEHLSFPAEEAPGVLPATMAGYVDPDSWAAGTPGGGVYQWRFLPVISNYVISVRGGLNVAAMLIIDEHLDDGDLASGDFRRVDAECYYRVP